MKKKLDIIGDALISVTDRVSLGYAIKKEYPYIVYDFDGSIDFEANNKNAEQALTGSIDLFTLDGTDPLFERIQAALRYADCAWRFNTKQTETNRDKTVFHFEWVWSVG